MEKKPKPTTGTAPALPACAFLDIETVRVKEHFSEMSERMQQLYVKKFHREIEAQKSTPDQHYVDNAGYLAEFSKVVCVSIGKHMVEEGKVIFKVKDIASMSEKALLNALSVVLAKIRHLCGHNLIEFDAPFLMRRYLINGIQLPNVLDSMGKKPWDLPYDDTMKMWSGSAYNHKISLDLLAELMGMPSPKSEMDGSKVAGVYFDIINNPDPNMLPFEREEIGLRKIADYCNGDVITDANIFCKMKGFNFYFKPEEVTYVKKEDQAA